MKSLSDLLKSHKIPGVKEAEIRRACAAGITKALGIPVTVKQVRFNDGVLTLKVPPVVKSALTLRFEEAKREIEREGVTITKIQ